MTKLINLYCTICQCNDTRFREKLQHSSNNKTAQFTDLELITVYLWGKQTGLLTRRAIHDFTKQYLLEWFPKLPSYQAFCRRLNRLAEAFAALAEIWTEQNLTRSEPSNTYIIDSCPIMVAKDSRSNSAKTAREICQLTRNPTKNQWYHGVKLHAFVVNRPHRLPLPCALQISTSTLCDLWAARQIDLDCAPVWNGTLYADRAYIDAGWKEWLKTQRNVDLVTPRKKKTYDTLHSADAASSFVSSIRQPIESYFNWLNEKTGIQDASHVRSLSGLMFHIFSCLAFAAFCVL